MANWRYTIDLHKVLGECEEQYDLEEVEFPCPEPVKTAIVAELDKAPPLRPFCADIKECKSIAAVNRVLDRVFNEADRKLVWCGMPGV